MGFWKRSPDPKATLERLIGDYELPSFPQTAIATLGLLRSDAPLTEVSERILTDPGLSVRILRTVNSAAFGLRQQVTNLRHAVSLLGRSRVESLILVAAVGETLPTPQGIDLAGFWRCSAHRACLARKIAAVAHPSQELESFTAGLLQDMAVPVLAVSQPSTYSPLYRRAQEDAESSLLEMERAELGFDHQQIGALIAQSWELPSPLVSAIADHHGGGEGVPEAVEAVARVRHSEPPDEFQSLREHCRDRLRITPEAVDAIIRAAVSETPSLADSMSPATARA